MNAIVVDDEPLARDGIKLLLEKIPALVIKGYFATAGEAEEYVLENHVDLVFLDINMPEMDGLAFARRLPSLALIIFTTAYPQYALESYELEAIDYLVKPIQPRRFERAVQKAISYHHLLAKDTNKSTVSIETDYIFVKADRKYVKVTLDDVSIIEGLKDYVVLHVAGQKIITALNIKTIYEQLPRPIFFRISKSYVVNVKKIKSFDHHFAIVDDLEIPIGKNYRSAFFEEYVNGKLLMR